MPENPAREAERPLADLTAAETVDALDRGRVTEFEIHDHYFRRAEGRQPTVRAWAHLEPQPDHRPRDRRRGHVQPLRGVPVAIKDLSDTVDMPTAYGSPLYAGNRPASDAACVALARAAGAVILGKTATVEFGASRPCETRNPHNLSHTPGGSSSGSAAAVADGQALLATGSQTGGSIIRPAAFCGVVGFKPSFGRLSTAGTRGFCWSLDTVGVFARNVGDAALFYRVLRGGEFGMPSCPVAQEEPLRIARFRGPFDGMVDAFLAQRLEEVEEAITEDGMIVAPIEADPDFTNTLTWQRTISRYEMACSLAYEWHACRNRLSEELVSEISEGMAIPWREYDLAKQATRKFANSIAAVIDTYDAILTFAAPGEAPLGLSSTGDATFNRSWSLLGLPCISLPLGSGPLGLPVALQLVGTSQEDDRLLMAALRLEQILLRMGITQKRLEGIVGP